VQKLGLRALSSCTCEGSTASWRLRSGSTAGSAAQGVAHLRAFCAVPSPVVEPAEAGQEVSRLVAPAPEEVAAGVEAVIAELRELKQEVDGGEIPHEQVQPRAAQALNLARQASVQDLLKLAQCFADLNLRVPLRDLAAAVGVAVRRCAPGQPLAEEAAAVVELLTIMGKNYMYVMELFEYFAERLEFLEGKHLAIYVFEAGRHGLRCRQFLNPAVPRAAHLASELALEDLMLCWHGFLRFNRDWKDFYNAARPRVATSLDSLPVADLLVVQRVARDHQRLIEYVELHAAVCARLAVQTENMTLSDGASALMGSPFSPRLRVQAHQLLRAIENAWTRQEDLSLLRINEICEALATFASWGMRPAPLMDRLTSMLVERAVELKYAGNPSLWVTATSALARVEDQHSKWPLVALEFARDRQCMDRINFTQQCAVVTALARLRVFDEDAYASLGNVVGREVRSFKDVEEIAPVLWAFATARSFPKELFDGVFDLAIEWLENEQVDLAKESTVAAWVQICWSFALAGYHKQYESFAAFLDYAFFNEVNGHGRVMLVRRAAQLADLVLCESPELANLVQYPDNMEAARSHSKVHRLLSSDPPADPALMQQLQATLRELQWSYEACSMTDSSCSVYADISLAPHFGHQIALLAGGHHDLWRTRADDDSLRHQSGRLDMVMRLLSARGWKCAVVSAFKWKQLETLDDKKAYLEQCVASAA